MTVNEGRTAEFERYIAWRLESNSNLLQSTNFTANSVPFKIRVYSENTDEVNIEDFSVLTDFIRSYEETFFVVQSFFDENGAQFGLITFWDSPEISINFNNEALPIKKLLFLENSYGIDFQYELVIAV